MAADLVVDSLDTDILVLGAGGAGLCAALHAADRAPRLTVTVAVKGLLGRAGCTRMVQGGYNAVLAAPDSIDAHLLDTLQGGAWINDQELVWTLVHEAPGRVLELEARYGCFFDRHPDGRIHQKPFAGQSHDRTIHKGDLTGIEIMNRLTEQVWRRPSIRPLEEHRAVELLRDDGGRVGGRAAARRAPRHLRWWCAAAPSLLAMGGGPTMYRSSRARPTSPPTASRSACARACGCATWRWCSSIRPGSSCPNSLMTGALLEEGLRGAGGRLLNGRGERFMAALRRRAHRAVHARPRRARLLHRGARGPRHRQRRRVDRRVAPGRRGGREELPRHGAAAAATSAATSRASRWRSDRPPTS